MAGFSNRVVCRSLVGIISASGLLALCSSATGAATSAPLAPERIRAADLDRPKAAPSATYTVRGEVVALPEVGKPATELMIRHEAIDNFANRKGDVVGMSAMIMEFPPQKGVDVRSLRLGDKVEVEFSVWWTQAPPWLATRITKLPGETTLEYRKADIARLKPPQPAQPTLPVLVQRKADPLDELVEDVAKLQLIRTTLQRVVPGTTVLSAEHDDEFPEQITVYAITVFRAGAGNAALPDGTPTDSLLITDLGTLLVHSTHSTEAAIPKELEALIRKTHPNAKLVSSDATVAYEWLVEFTVGVKHYIAVLSPAGDFSIEESEGAEVETTAPAKPPTPEKPVMPVMPNGEGRRGPGF